MIKVFLVEDEVIMRSGIKNNIPWEQEGFLFVGEASDGELAYPLIKQEKPDILITDIRMPFMDGLELSRIVKKELPKTKIMILSGYNEFDYAKQAIDIGVTDYLLKPITPAKILEAVRRVADIIEKEREQEALVSRYQQEMVENLHLEQLRLWNTLASGTISAVELLERGRTLGLDFAAAAHMVALFKVTEGDDATGGSRRFVELTDQINALAGTWQQVLVFERSPEGWVFLVKGDSEDEVRRRFQRCCEGLVHLTEAYQGIEYFGGCGSVVFRLGSIRTSYLEASKAFSSRFFTGGNRIVYCEEMERLHMQEEERIEVAKLRPRKTDRELAERFLKSGTKEEVKSFLEEYFRNITGQQFQSLLYRQYVIMELVFAVTDFLNSIGISPEKLPESYQNVNRIVERGRNLPAVHEEMAGLFLAALSLRDGRARKKYAVLLEQACRYIEENYQNEEISLNLVAAQVGISPGYFSTIFSSETGKTFVEYLTAVRLERAKELLMCSNMRTAEIAYEVGYRDSHYFSYIFKKVTGASPKEYKRRGQETV